MAALATGRPQLRRELRDRRSAMAPAQKERADERLRESLSRHLQQVCPRSVASTTVACYWPIAGEPDLRPIWGDWGTVALPVVTRPDEALRFARWTMGAPMRLGAHDVPVPEPAEWIEPDIVVLPCLGFFIDRQGRRFRLGYGGGFYDRTLESRRWPTVGVAYDESLLDALAIQTHDIALDAIITPSRTY